MNHFLLQQQDGSYLYLFYEQKNSSLSMKRYTQKGLLTHTGTMLRQGIEADFSCVMDPGGKIHIAFSTTNGSIHYGYFLQNTFRSFPILAAKAPAPYPRHICILPAKDMVTIFYVVRHGEKQILSMQQVDSAENAFSAPVAIDYLWHEKENFAACQKEDGTILLAYSRTFQETKGGIHVIRTLENDGSVIQQQEILQTCKEPLWMDHFCIDKKNRLTLLAHTIPYTMLYFYRTENDHLQSVDLTPYPRTRNTFFGMANLPDAAHCYFCTDSICYDSIQTENGQLTSFQKQPRPYNVPIYPIALLTEGKQVLLPGTIGSRPFFYFYNPFAAKREPDRLSQLEKRVSALEGQIARLEKYIKTPRDVVGRNFDT